MTDKNERLRRMTNEEVLRGLCFAHHKAHAGVGGQLLCICGMNGGGSAACTAFQELIEARDHAEQLEAANRWRDACEELPPLTKTVEDEDGGESPFSGLLLVMHTYAHYDKVGAHIPFPALATLDSDGVWREVEKEAPLNVTHWRHFGEPKEKR